MTYSRDYPDVDPSVHPAPITHRVCTGAFSSFLSFSFSFYQRTHRSSLRPRFFMGVPLPQKKKKKREKRKKLGEIEKPFRRLGMRNEAFCRAHQRPLLSLQSFSTKMDSTNCEQTIGVRDSRRRYVGKYLSVKSPKRGPAREIKSSYRRDYRKAA